MRSARKPPRIMTPTMAAMAMMIAPAKRAAIISADLQSSARTRSALLHDVDGDLGVVSRHEVKLL
ncbi:hypothetical protein CWO89_18325 [Bradyrhizobium sp. Leo170]|nr:hypothetical protein CWO89_18325 [Bradyrhizobium sp. Leo170]